MDNSALHFAIRELQAAMRLPTPWICAAAAGIILGLLAPFGTEETLPLLPRIGYWVFLACLTLFTGTFVNSLMRPLATRAPAMPHVLGLTVACGVGLLIGVAVLTEVFVLNWLVFRLSPLRTGYGVPVAINTLAISVLINGVITYVTDQLAKAAPPAKAGADLPAQTRQPEPALLARLPFDKRGRLISLSVQDHYVEVTTAKGREMLLMRLGDAIGEAGAGFQIHRSHWVAEDAIAGARRKGSAAELTTCDGRALPVSRTYLPVLKEKGLLPRQAPTSKDQPPKATTRKD